MSDVRVNEADELPSVVVAVELLRLIGAAPIAEGEEASATVRIGGEVIEVSRRRDPK